MAGTSAGAKRGWVTRKGGLNVERHRQGQLFAKPRLVGVSVSGKARGAAYLTKESRGSYRVGASYGAHKLKVHATARSAFADFRRRISKFR